MSSTVKASSSETVKNLSYWSIGVAMFAMFFGAGNIVFPLALGQLTQDNNLYAVFGMIITAVLIPLTGLLGMMLFDGDYNAFFRRIGKWPAFALIVVILGLIGPFGGIPRCITITYSTLNNFGLDTLPGVNLVSFSIISCLIIFIFTYRPKKIIGLLSYVLTPVLLLSLAIIIVKGLITMPGAGPSTHTGMQSFSFGLLGGYNTMDLLAAFFFSSVVLIGMKKGKEALVPLRDNKKLLSLAIMSSGIAAGLLTLVYVCFSFLAAGYSSALSGVPSHEILGKLAYDMMGPYAGLVVGVAVSFACITTEIALAAVVAQFLQKSIFKERISYLTALVMTLIVAGFISTLHFEGISAFLVPILEVCYPGLIVLTVLNILYKLYDFKPVKSLVYATFLISLVFYFI